MEVKPWSRPKAVPALAWSGARRTRAWASAGRSVAASKARRWAHCWAESARARRRGMSALLAQLAHGDRPTAQPRLDHPHTETGPREDGRLAAMSESHALDADVLGEEQGAER